MSGTREKDASIGAIGQGERQEAPECRHAQRGWTVLAARENRGWTLDECAHASGFSLRQIMDWEHGRRGITVESLSRLAQGYRMTDAEISAVVLGETQQAFRDRR